MEVTEELIRTSMDLLTVMTVEELAAELQISTEQALTDFLSSGTGQMLYDEQTKLWWDGPAAIAQMYKDECRRAAGAH